MIEVTLTKERETKHTVVYIGDNPYITQLYIKKDGLIKEFEEHPEKIQVTVIVEEK